MVGRVALGVDLWAFREFRVVPTRDQMWTICQLSLRAQDLCIHRLCVASCRSWQGALGTCPNHGQVQRNLEVVHRPWRNLSIPLQGLMSKAQWRATLLQPRDQMQNFPKAPGDWKDTKVVVRTRVMCVERRLERGPEDTFTWPNTPGSTSSPALSVIRASWKLTRTITTCWCTEGRCKTADSQCTRAKFFLQLDWPVAVTTNVVFLQLQIVAPQWNQQSHFQQHFPASSQSAYHAVPTRGTTAPKRSTANVGERPRGKRKYVCNICGAEFNAYSGRYYHMATHTGKFKYTCELCDKGFMKTDAYRKHISGHRKRLQTTRFAWRPCWICFLFNLLLYACWNLISWREKCR